MHWLSRLVRSKPSTITTTTAATTATALRTSQTAGSARKNSKQPQLPIPPLLPLWLRLCPPILLEKTSYHYSNRITTKSMEVTRDDYEKDDSKLLKDIVEAIKTAQFVAIDLEFSGVQRKTNVLGRKQNIRERYLQLKEGAEKYQVLQFGICTVQYDETEATYICRPYTFPLCPVTDPKWQMEREYTYQSSAIKFLSDNHFDFNLLFSSGVRYLSHEEEKYVRDKEEKAIGGIMEDIHIEESQEEFLKSVVNELQAWIDDPNPEYDFINITGPNNEINGYQKRLVHQVVRAKFPELVTMSRSKFIQVIKRDDEQEATVLKERKERSDYNIKKGIGLRYVFDALKERKVPIVGHNLFGDLIHLYRTFVGALPPTVEDFAAKIHEDFPVVCDTKYIATCEGHQSGAASNLQTLSDTLNALLYPSISLHLDHQMGANVDHNAGYDSFVTAKVLLKLITSYQSRLGEGKEPAAEKKAREGMVEFINLMGQYDPAHSDQAAAQGDELLLPPFDSRVWNGLKNRLRVNGTEECVVVLDTIDEDGGVKLLL